MQTAEKLLLNATEAAEFLGVSRPTFYQIAKRADFSAGVRIGTRCRFSRAALIAWVDEQTKGGVENGEQ